MERCSFTVWDFQLRLSRWMDNVQLKIFNLQVDFCFGNLWILLTDFRRKKHAGHSTK